MSAVQSLKYSLQQPVLWAALFLAIITCPILAYMVLPAMGITTPAHLLSLPHLALGMGLIIAGFGYFCFFQYVTRHPVVLVYFYLLVWPVLNWVELTLSQNFGLNLHLRPILLLMIAAPLIRQMLVNRRFFGRIIPHFKYYAIFWVILVSYFFLFNQHAHDPQLGGQGILSEGAVDIIQIFAYTYCLLGIIAAASTSFTHENANDIFDQLNRWLLVITGIEALITIIGYPFGVLSIRLDGFQRAFGIFSHPNPYAHHMGILLIYMIGLFCYYQNENKSRLPNWLLIGSIAVNLLAFLLGLSKTAIAVFSLSTLVLCLITMPASWMKQTALRFLGLAIVIIPLGLWAFEHITSQSFFDLISARLEDQTSMNWRLEIWNDLVAGIQGIPAIIGHGFTSANELVYQLTYNNQHNAKPLMMVHNAYIALVYDMGVFGLTFFAAAIALLVKAGQMLLHPLKQGSRALTGAIIALTLYFLLVCGFDEMSYMFDAPQLFWVLVTLLYCHSLRESVVC